MAEPIPTCFGDAKLWDPKEKECAGGLDPAFTDDNGSHYRQKCLFFEACGTKVQASKVESARALIDPKSLVRPSAPLLGPARPPEQSFVESFARSLVQQQYMPPVAQQPQQYVPPAQQLQQRSIHLPPQAVQAQPQQFYQQMMPVNYQMPAYLSVPEVREVGESFWAVLARTVLRSIGKSLGHSVANMFDTVPLGPPTQNVASQKNP